MNEANNPDVVAFHRPSDLTSLLREPLLYSANFVK
jgi:hypothetical protein